MAYNFQKMKLRYNNARKLYHTQTAKLATVAAYCRPRDQDYFLDNDYSGDNPQGNLYDSTAPNAIRTLADKALMTLMPTNTNWFSIGLAEYVLQDDDIDEDEKEKTQKKLSKTSAKLDAMFNNSNFRSVLTDALVNFYAFGYALIKINPNASTGTFEFDSIANDGYAMEQTPSSKNVSVFMRRKWRVRDWNLANPTKRIESDSVSEESMTHIVTGRIFIGTVKEEIDGVVIYRQKVAEVIFQEKDDTYLSYTEKESGTGQLVLGRIQPATGETYPTGIGGRILPEAQTLNKLGEYFLDITQWKATTIFEASLDSEIPDNFKPIPGTIVRTDSDTFKNGGGLRPLDVGGNPGAVLQAINELRGKISDTLNLVQSTSEVPQFRTATEWVLQEAREKETVGPLLDAAKEELLIPVLKHCLKFAQDMGMIDDRLEVSGSYYALTVSGAEEERDKLSKLRRLEALEERTAPIFAINPTAVMVAIDENKKINMIIEALDLHQITRPSEVRKEMEEKILAEQQAQEQQGPPQQS